MIINIVKLFVCVIATILFFRIVRSFARRENQNLLFFPIAIYFIFFVLPLILDITIGRYIPTYKFFGFFISYNNFNVELIYCVGVLFSMIVFYKSFKKNNYALDIEYAYIHKDIAFFVVLMIGISFVCYILFSLDHDSLIRLLSYETRYYESNDILNTIRTNSFLFSVFLLLPLFLERKAPRFWFKTLLISPMIIFIILCNGKKSIVFLLAAVFIFIVYNNKIIKSYLKMSFFAVITFGLLLLFYNYYINNVVIIRSYNTFEERYYTFREELGRDDTQKMVIYNELYDNNKILSYRGESLLLYPTFFVPRESWAKKPYPFATYFTAKLIDLSSVRYVGWNMTTSIYDELICNTGLIAIFYTPFLICFFSNLLMKKFKWNKLLDIIIKLLGILLITLSLVVQINAHLTLNLVFLVLLALWFVANFILKKKRG